MPDVWGTQFADDARDKIVTLMEALKVQMATGYDPTFSYVYDSHATALLRLNAVTVEIIESEATFMGVDDGPSLDWAMAVSCRIHTAYQGDRFNERDTHRLAESVANKLESNLKQTDNYRIEHVVSIQNQQEFAESVTIGAEVICLMKIYTCYPQETT